MIKRKEDSSDICEVGGLVRIYRDARKLSQEQLGNLIGTDRNRIYAYEKGANEMGIAAFFKIAEALEISPMMLFPERFREKAFDGAFTPEEMEYLDNFSKLDPEVQDLILKLESIVLELEGKTE